MNQRSETSWSFPSAASKFSKIDEELVTAFISLSARLESYDNADF